MKLLVSHGLSVFGSCDKAAPNLMKPLFDSIIWMLLAAFLWHNQLQISLKEMKDTYTKKDTDLGL